MRDAFKLDALPTHELEPLAPDTIVVNPLRCACDKALRRLNQKLARLRNRVAEATRKKRPTSELRSEVRSLEDPREMVMTSRREVPRHRRAGDLDEAEWPDALPSRPLLDIIRMNAYRADTCIMLPVVQAQGKKIHPRKLLRTLMTADADILPEPADGVLGARITCFGNNACERRIDALLSELNASGTIFPGTGLRMVHDVEDTAESDHHIPHKISGGQEV